MIVTISELVGRSRGHPSTVAIGRAAAAAGATVQAVGVVSDDSDGDRRLLELTVAGVGHAAVLRGPARALEAADVDLALRYLPDVRVVVAIGMPADVLARASEQADWCGAALVAVNVANQTADLGTPSGAEASQAALPDSAIVLAAPPSDPDDTFAGFVGALAARLDAGATPADAWAATSRELAIDPIPS